MPTWIESPPIAIPPAFAEAVGGHPLVAQALARRGVIEVEAARAFLDPAFYAPCAPDELPGLGEIAGRLERALRREQMIWVWGDFDVDGQTSTALLVGALRDLGGRVAYHIPVRANESHGVNLPVLERIAAGEFGPRPEVLLTCDTGIAAHEAAAFARSNGIEMLVTDHHQLPAELPAAAALTNPQFLPPGHPLGTLPGVGVAYKLAEELYRRFQRGGECEQYLDLAALGIVADVALLRGDTRYLLQLGLEKLRQPQRLGLQVMMELAELNPAWLTEEHIGFSLGPRLNALGRLGDANPAVELLTTQDLGRARLLAQQLEGFNARRQLLTRQVYQAAQAQIEAEPGLLDEAVLVLAQPAWPAGVIGIVASRLVERYGKPTILIATPQGEVGRGSARSVDGLDITVAIAAQSALLEGFGGHSMAAGLGILPERIPEFRRAISRWVARHGGERPEASLSIDADLPFSALSLELAADLERLAPFGAGNPPLTLAARGLRLVSQAYAGRSQEHLLLTVEDGQGETRRLVWWQAGEEARAALPQGLFDLAYRLRTSTYRGQRELQLEWADARPLQEAIALPEAPRLEVLDYRNEGHPLVHLQRLAGEGDVQVWAEADAVAALQRAGELPCPLRSRYDLEPAGTLVIWTAPPGRAELRAALERAQARRVALFAIDPGLDAPQAFLSRLAGLVKHVIQSKGGRAGVAQLSAAMAHAEGTLRLGLAWLAALGHVQVDFQDGEVRLAAGGAPDPQAAERLEVQVKARLEESAAFRAYLRRMDAEGIVL